MGSLCCRSQPCCYGSEHKGEKLVKVFAFLFWPTQGSTNINLNHGWYLRGWKHHTGDPKSTSDKGTILHQDPAASGLFQPVNLCISTPHPHAPPVMDRRMSNSFRIKMLHFNQQHSYFRLHFQETIEL